MAQEKDFELIHMPWWGWLLVLAIFETCAILVFHWTVRMGSPFTHVSSILESES